MSKSVKKAKDRAAVSKRYTTIDAKIQGGGVRFQRISTHGHIIY